MDWTGIAGCVVGAWAFLLIFSGERIRRVQEVEQNAAAKEAQAADEEPIILTSPTPNSRPHK